MATNEEIVNSRIIGYIEPLGNNARVTVIGYKNPDGEYVVLEASKAKRVFFPDGKVFAGKFQFEREDNPIKPYSFIEFSVITSPKSADFDGDEYILNYHDNSKKCIQKSFIQIESLKYQTSLESGFLTQDEIFTCINKNELNDISGYFFFKYGNYLYGLFKYEANTETVRPATGKESKAYEIDDETYKSKCFKINQKEYYLGSTKEIPFKQIGLIDCMDDKQLGDWFKGVLKSMIDSEAILSISKETLQNFSTHYKETNDEIDEIRLERIKGKIDSLKFTYNEIKELLISDSPLTKTLKETVLEMKSEYRAEWAKDLENDKKTIEKELEKLVTNKKKLNDEYTSLASKFKAKEEALSKSISEYEEKNNILKNNHDSMIEEMKIMLSINHSGTSNEIIPIEPISFVAEGKCYTELDENEGYSYSSLLQKNVELEKIPDSVKEQFNQESELFKYQACFIPNIAWAYLYAKAIRNSKLYVIHVEHDWLHFNDFINNGLKQALKDCYEKETINHIIVFDSINLTQPECGLKPLLDNIAGYSFILPNINKSLPNNLKIFATILPFDGQNKIGLPLSKKSFNKWGQISNPTDLVCLNKNFMNCENTKGYFEPKDLTTETNALDNQDNHGYFAE